MTTTEVCLVRVGSNKTQRVKANKETRKREKKGKKEKRRRRSEVQHK